MCEYFKAIGDLLELRLAFLLVKVARMENWELSGQTPRSYLLGLDTVMTLLVSSLVFFLLVGSGYSLFDQGDNQLDIGQVT